MRLAARHGLTKAEEIPDEPGPFAYVWQWFLDLHSRRQFDGAAGFSQPISWREIKAWSDVTETPLASHEIRLLTTLDDFFLGEERKARVRESKKTASKKARPR